MSDGEARADGRAQGPWTVVGNFARASEAKLAAGDLRGVLVRHARFCDRLVKVKGSRAFERKPTPVLREFAAAHGFEWGDAPLVWGRGSLVAEFPYVVAVGGMVCVFHFDCPGMGDGALVRYFQARGGRAVEGPVVTVLAQARGGDPAAMRQAAAAIDAYAAQAESGRLPDYWREPPPWREHRPSKENEFSAGLAPPVLCRAITAPGERALALFVNLYNAGIGAVSILSWFRHLGLERLSLRGLPLMERWDGEAAMALLGSDFAPSPGTEAPAPRPQATAGEDPRALAEAETLLREGQVEEALKALQAYLEAHPHDTEALALFGQALESSDRTSSAKTTYHNLLQLDPGNRPGLISLGLLHLHDGDPARAIPLFQRAAAIADDAQVHQCLAQAWLAQGDRRQALAAVEHALESDPQFIPALVLAAELHEELGSSEEAIACYKRILLVNPMHRGARAALTRLTTPPATAAERPPARPSRLASFFQRLFRR